MYISAETVPSPSADIRRDLIAMRTKHHGNAPLANRLSIQIEQLRELETAEGERRLTILEAVRKNLAEIEQIQRDGFYKNPLAHLTAQA